MSLHNSKLVACGGEVVVAAACNVAVVGDVAAVVGIVATDDDVVMVGVAAAVAIWVQHLMIPCTSPQFHFVSTVATLTGKELSWWDR